MKHTSLLKKATLTTMLIAFSAFGLLNAQTVIENWTQLNNIRNFLSGSYMLGNNLDKETTDYYTVLFSGKIPQGDWEEGTYNANDLVFHNGFYWTTAVTTDDEPDNGTDWSKAAGWLPITGFSGTLDGKGYSIAGLYLHRPATNNQGLFGNTSGAVISNLTLADVIVRGNNYSGAITGRNNNTVISSCKVTGVVTGTDYVGGIAGDNTNNGIISSSSNYATVSGTNRVGGITGDHRGQIEQSCNKASISGNDYIGGIAGYMLSESATTKSFNTGAISGADRVGGIAGDNRGSISDCYSRGSVTGTRYLGGLIGYTQNSSISNSFSTGSVAGSHNTGGMVGWSNRTATYSYWNTNTSGQSSSATGTGKTTAEMTYPYSGGTFSGWDWDGIWEADEDYQTNNGYPFLQWQIFMSADPAVAVNPQPTNGQTGIAVNLEYLSWQYFSNRNYTDPAGFRVYFNTNGLFGEEDDFEWIEYDNTQETFYTENIPALPLDFAATCFWKVVPTTDVPDGRTNQRTKRNSKLATRQSQLTTRGDAEDVPVWSFTTRFDTSDFADGNGSQEFPYIVTSPQELTSVRNYTDSYFRQASDIIFTAEMFDVGGDFYNDGDGWEAIPNFTGSYDGNSYLIDSLYINRPNQNDQGLFKILNGATVKKLGLTNLSVNGSNNVGGIAGNNQGNIIECYVTGFINVAGNNGGGVTGINEGSISNSYNRANITGGNNIGGLTGENDGDVEYCFSTGNVTGNNSCGGLIGTNSGTVTSSYWDKNTSGQISSSGGTGKTTAEMTYPYEAATYSGWDFGDTWKADNQSYFNNGYPFLKWQPAIYGRPVPATNPNPAHNAVDISIHLGVLKWDYLINAEFTNPAGFRVYFNTTGIFSVGDAYDWVPFNKTQVTYSSIALLPAQLQNTTAYYWKVVPTTSETSGNDAVGVTVWSFTTIGTATGFASGSGTAEAPWVILTAEHLNNVRNYLGSTHANKHFIQMADIDLSSHTSEGGAYWNGGAGWQPIGSDFTPSFRGNYNGNNKQVSGLFINRPATDNQGLFGFTHSAMITRLGVTGVNITGKDYVGGLIGNNRGSIVTECYSTGQVAGNNYVGGLVGYSTTSPATVQGSYSTAAVTGNERVGGLIGDNRETVENSYSTGKVTGNDRVGGLIGSLQSNTAVIYCYSTGKVTGNTNTGGLIGWSNSTVTNCFWDKDSSGQSSSSRGISKTTEEMLLAATFSGWDFGEEWVIQNGVTYPYLKWQGNPIDENIPQRYLPNDPASGSNVYRKTFTDLTTTFIADEDDNGTSVIRFVYTTDPAYSSARLFSKPENLAALYGFYYDSGSVLLTGQRFLLQFKNVPNNIWYRYNGSNWRIVPSAAVIGPQSPEFTYEINIGNLNLYRTRSDTYIEFAADKGEAGQTLPVELSSFTGSLTSELYPQLKWTAETETNMIGYNIYRGINEKLNDAVKVNFVIIPAHNTSVAKNYSFIDRETEPGQVYYYWLQSQDLDLTHEFHGPVSVLVDDSGEEQGRIEIPFVTAIIGNYPNPFNPGTYISFSLDEPSSVSLTVFNLRGQTVRHLVTDLELPISRKHSIYWDGTDESGKRAASGTYLYKLQTDKDFTEVGKMLMLK